jgi:hypothetical protein
LRIIWAALLLRRDLHRRLLRHHRLVVAIVFTGQQAQGRFDFLLKAHRLGSRVSAYLYLLTDTYPKFD